MTLHPFTIFSAVVEGIALVLCIGCTIDSTRLLRTHWREQKRKSAYQGARAALMQTPLLLRIFYTVASYASVLMILWSLVMCLVVVDPRTKQADPIRPVAQPWLDAASHVCITSGKYAPSTYVIIKLCCYLFYFIKQRTVRVMQPKLNWQEKQVLLTTASMLPLMGVAGWLVQGDASALDNSCTLWIPIYLLVFMFGADTGLSSAYLFLFLQPLRETMKQNRQRADKGRGQQQTASPPRNLVIAVSPTPGARTLGAGAGSAGSEYQSLPSPTAAERPQSPTAPMRGAFGAEMPLSHQGSTISPPAAAAASSSPSLSPAATVE